MDILSAIHPITPLGVFFSLLCGFIVGLERQISGKPAGIRTSSLICMGSYIFTSIGITLIDADAARVVGQIITGIGFIGAGVILAREGNVIGVTSAAVIWVLAGAGMLIGFERYLSAIAISAVTVLILVGVTYLEKIFKELRQGVYKTVTKKIRRSNDRDIEG